MSKTHGLGARVYVDGYDLSTFIESVGTIAGKQAPLGMTDITQLAMERHGGVLDGNMEFKAFLATAAGEAHPVLRNYDRSNRLVSYAHRATLGAPVAGLVATQVDYGPTREKNGRTLFDVKADGALHGLEWGLALTADTRTDTTDTDGTGVSFGASYDFGLQAWLHVTEFTGTNVTIKLQESSDDGSSDAYADVTGGAFSSVTSGPTWERIETARDQTIEEYLRVVTTGTFTSVSFFVGVAVNHTDHTGV